MVCMPSQPLSAFGLGTRRARRPNVDSFCLEHRSAANSGAAGHSPHQLPSLHDIQVGWLLLFCCACPRTQCALRTLSTASTHGYATRHDAAVLRCLTPARWRRRGIARTSRRSCAAGHTRAGKHGNVIQVREDASTKIRSDVKLQIPQSCMQARLHNAGLKRSPCSTRSLP